MTINLDNIPAMSVEELHDMRELTLKLFGDSKHGTDTKTILDAIDAGLKLKYLLGMIPVSDNWLKRVVLEVGARIREGLTIQEKIDRQMERHYSGCANPVQGRVNAAKTDNS